MASSNMGKFSWNVVKIFAQKCSNDDTGLTLTFLWQDQFFFSGFHMGRVYGTCRWFWVQKLINVLKGNIQKPPAKD